MESEEKEAPKQQPLGYRRNSAGHLVPEEMVKDIDMARDELVREIITAAQAMKAQLAALKKRSMQDVFAFVDLSAEKYGISIGGQKGNISLMSYDGKYKVQIAVAERLTFDERLIAAKALIDQCIHRWSEGSPTEIKALVEHAFQTDKEGKISTSRVLGLTQLKIKDEQWQQAMQALRDSMQIAGTTTYIRMYQRRGLTDQYEQIVLDLASS
ncbi:MAG TPA: DUF3164 family protein [Nitrosomonas sp.]|nr:DUF3164 family protein [Nitrosomonas sp.]HNJ38227.1 DUF3164 family protein [Nitrosomonas sp.]